MQTITIQLPDDLAVRAVALGDDLPRLIADGLRSDRRIAEVNRYVIDFFAGRPSPSEILMFSPTREIQDRVDDLLSKQRAGGLTDDETHELREYVKIHEFIRSMKATAKVLAKVSEPSE